MEQLMQLKQLYASGFITAEEFNARRIELVNQLTGTSGSASGTPAASPAGGGYPSPAAQPGGFSQPAAMGYGAQQPQQPSAYPQQQQQAGYQQGNAAYGNQRQALPSNIVIAGGAGGASPAARNPYIPKPVEKQPQYQAVPKIEKKEPKRREMPKNVPKDYVNWEFFHAAQANNVPRLKELLDQGVNINQQDTDTQNCACHYAAMKGQKHALYYLVERGCDPNCQNKRGQTCLHNCVTNRFTNLAIWLVQNGADIDIEDSRGFTPADLALPWLQKELKDAQCSREKKEKEEEQLREARLNIQNEPAEEYYDDEEYEDEYNDYDDYDEYDEYDEPTQRGMMQQPSQYGGLQQQASQARMSRTPSAYHQSSPQMQRQTSQRPNSMMRPESQRHLVGGSPQLQRPQSQMMRNPSQRGRPNSSMARTGSQRSVGGGGRPNSQLVRPPSTYSMSQAAQQPQQNPEEAEREQRLQKVESETVYKSTLSVKKEDPVEEEITQEVMRVFLRNQAYKSLVITSVTKAGDVCSMMAEKLGLERFACEFDVIEYVKGNEKRVDPGANIMRLKKLWPTILGQAGNETDKHCKLIVAPKRGASSDVQSHYRNAMYGK